MKGKLLRLNFIPHPSAFILNADALPHGRATAFALLWRLYVIADDDDSVAHLFDGRPMERRGVRLVEAEAREETHAAVDELADDARVVRDAVLGLAAAAQVEDVADERPVLAHDL